MSLSLTVHYTPIILAFFFCELSKLPSNAAFATLLGILSPWNQCLLGVFSFKSQVKCHLPKVAPLTIPSKVTPSFHCHIIFLKISVAFNIIENYLTCLSYWLFSPYRRNSIMLTTISLPSSYLEYVLST